MVIAAPVMLVIRGLSVILILTIVALIHVKMEAIVK